MDLYLIRHTCVQGAEGLCYGRSDIPLAPSFRAEAEAVKRSLPPGPLIIHSSPSARCLELARYLGGEDIRVSPELQELDFGAWEARAWEAIPREDLERWGREYVDRACPQGESLRDMAGRVLPFWENLVREPVPGRVLVTHAGPIRVILASLLHLQLEEMFSLPVGFGSVRRIRCQIFSQDPLMGNFTPLLLHRGHDPGERNRTC